MTPALRFRKLRDNRQLTVKPAVRNRSTGTVLATWFGLYTQSAHASFLSGETLDTAADIVALVVLFVVPVMVIALFWLVHIIPEKVAEKREHPQKETIKVLCLLSLVFGGMLWPIAWIWAYSKPVLHKMAYGTDKHDDFYKHLNSDESAEASTLTANIRKLRAELDGMAAREQLPESLVQVRKQLVDIETHLTATAGKEGAG